MKVKFHIKGSQHIIHSHKKCFLIKMLQFISIIGLLADKMEPFS